MEIVICAAIKTKEGKIIRGHRHNDAMRTAVDCGLTFLGDEDAQGFITSLNRYVDRKEARKIQEVAGISSVADGGYRLNILFSEDLY